MTERHDGRCRKRHVGAVCDAVTLYNVESRLELRSRNGLLEHEWAKAQVTQRDVQLQLNAMIATV